MAGRDHFVIDKFLCGAQMAGQTFFRAVNDVARVGHAKRQRARFFSGDSRSVCWPSQAMRGAVAIFTAHAFRDFKWAAALLWRSVERVASQTLRRLFRFRTELQNARHAFADVAGERLIRRRACPSESRWSIRSEEFGCPRRASRCRGRLVAAQEPGPMYFASAPFESCALAMAANRTQRHSTNSRMRWATNCIAEKRELFRMNALRRMLRFYLRKNKESTTAKRDVHKLNAGRTRGALQYCSR